MYSYTYHEMKIIVDGEFDISDETGQKVHAVKGDVFYFPKGSKITFTTESFGLGFYVGQRKVRVLRFSWKVMDRPNMTPGRNCIVEGGNFAADNSLRVLYLVVRKSHTGVIGGDKLIQHFLIVEMPCLFLATLRPATSARLFFEHYLSYH